MKLTFHGIQAFDRAPVSSRERQDLTIASALFFPWKRLSRLSDHVCQQIRAPLQFLSQSDKSETLQGRLDVVLGVDFKRAADGERVWGFEKVGERQVHPARRVLMIIERQHMLHRMSKQCEHERAQIADDPRIASQQGAAARQQSAGEMAVNADVFGLLLLDRPQLLLRQVLVAPGVEPGLKGTLDAGLTGLRNVKEKISQLPGLRSGGDSLP